MIMKEVFKPTPDEPADPGRVFYTITADDVGKTVIITTIGAVYVRDISGGVHEGDVGRRLYRVPVNGEPVIWIWQAENDAQRDARLARTPGPPALVIRNRALTKLEKAMIPLRGCGSHHVGECSDEWPYNFRD
jgi:hypothetical protein